MKRSGWYLGLGSFGALMTLLGLRLWWRIVSGPGDDNPMGLVGVVVMLVALLPAYGLVLFARREPLRRHVPWLVASCATGAALVLVLPVLLQLR